MKWDLQSKIWSPYVVWVVRSTKKGKRSKGFIGEKGIGYKSVFLVSKVPHIVSNGYKVKFSEEPDKDCGIGYIVPTWISDESFVSKIQRVYGSELLPTTTIVLPLKTDKVKFVKDELSSLHPELLLFLSKLRRLCVHESSTTFKKTDSVTVISIVSENKHIVSKVKATDSRVIHLSVKGKSGAREEKCQYYLWRQAFPVTPEAKVSGRADVEEWTVSLAFPFGKRLKRGTSSVGVFAFLPTSMATNFPFVIQADFILASSQESILFDNRWNKGILECVPDAFVSAFTSCVKEGSPVFTSVAQAFEFLPSHASPFPELNRVRETIKLKLCNAMIVPCETFGPQMTFCKPANAVRIHQSFRDILFKLKQSGVSLAGISSMNSSLVHSSLNKEKYNASLTFLGINRKHDWYKECFAACNLISQASDDIYIDILFFVSMNPGFFNDPSIPLFKLINESNEVGLCSLSRIQMGHTIQYGSHPKLHSWLCKCKTQFGFPIKIFSLPDSLLNSLTVLPKPGTNRVLYWLSTYGGINPCSDVDFISRIHHHVSQRGRDPHADVILSRFLYHSKLKKLLTEADVSSALKYIPVVDGSGCVRVYRSETLVPTSGSKWAKLFGPKNPFSQDSYVDIGEAYAASSHFAGEHTPSDELLSFMITYAEANDLPEIRVPNSPLQIASSKMTKDKAFLLVDWIRFNRTRGVILPERFLESIRCGKWMKTKTGVDCPRNCIIPNENGKAMLEMMNQIPTGFSVVDEAFYGNKISLYIDKLKFLGVQCGIDGVKTIVMDRFKVLAESAMTKEVTFSLLQFISFLKARNMLDEQWVMYMSQLRLLKTKRSYAAPRDSVYFPSDSEAEAASLMTSLDVIDKNFYGDKLFVFVDALKILGFRPELKVYALAAGHLSFPQIFHP